MGSNATASNATASNAMGSNAMGSNATASNAMGSNAMVGLRQNSSTRCVDERRGAPVLVADVSSSRCKVIKRNIAGATQSFE